MLLDTQGVPLSSPNLFATVRLRNAGLAVNSIKNKLNELKTLLRWQREYDRDLEAEFRVGNFLSVADVISIRDFTARKLGPVSVSRTSRGKVARIPEASLAPVANQESVSKQVHYNRLTTIADYVEFLGQTAAANRSDSDSLEAVDRMAKYLRRHRPRGMSSYQGDEPERLSPPSELVEEFVRVGSEGHPENPFRRGRIQRRNELIFRLLLETGIRLGELLSLTLNNMELGEKPYITVRRTHDDRHDPRAYQPVAKTKERAIPISVDLAVTIHSYSMEDRAKTPGANRHPYLIVTHRKGRTCGHPLSVSSVSNKVFGSMHRVREAFAGIHPHSFRHHINCLLSKEVDDHNRRARSLRDPAIQPMSEEREKDIRAHLLGHRSTESGKAYNLRHVRETSDQAVQDLQQSLMERSMRSKAGNDE